MDDRFLEQARREPRPEFAADLRARLRRRSEGGESRRFVPRPGLALAAGIAVAAAAALIAFPSVRASAEAFLDLFRVRNFTAVQFDPARLEKVRAMDQNNSFMVFDHAESLREPGAPQVYPTPEAAGAAAGLDLRQPTYLPSGLALDTVMVEGAGEARLSVHPEKLRALLDALDLRDVQVPPGLEGQVVTVHKPPIVMERFRRGGLKMILVQARSPEVSLPAGVDLERLGEIGLRILGLDAAEAHRIGQSIDWHSTLVVPVPLNASTFRRVTVHGNPGLLVTTQGDAGAAAPGGAGPASREHIRDGTVLLWTEGDRVFALMSVLGGPALIQVAESMR